MVTPKSSGKSSSPSLVVTIGASAGGLAALKDFFSTAKKSSKITFVIIQHMDEKGKALAQNSISRITKQTVQMLKQGERLKTQTVYLVPPHKLLSFENGRTLLKEASSTALKLSTIDHGFKAISKEFGDRCVGVLLSGQGSDGALGLERINHNGGLTIVQDPLTADHRSMPDNAIATGKIDRFSLREKCGRKSNRTLTLLNPRAIGPSCPAQAKRRSRRPYRAFAKFY